MNYEVVSLKEKKVIGLSAKTNNAAPDIGEVIGGLWEQMFQEGVYDAIPNKANDKALGIYTDYADKEQGDYTILVACEVTESETIPQGMIERTLPAGNYAKFIVKGHMVTAVQEFWQQLWTIDLPRAFTYDFEEYQDNEMENAEIHMYISLKE